MKKHIYKIAFVLILAWIGLMAWDQIVGLPEMSSQLRNTLTWFPTLIVGLVWAFSGKKDDE
jgi:hypothetical protein